MEEIGNISEQLKEALERKSFFLLGAFNPEDKANLRVVVFSSTDLRTP